jgi:hypothetical protein
MTTLAFAGCSSSPSVAKRSAKLSTGIQKAYSVAPDTANRVFWKNLSIKVQKWVLKP